MQYGCLQQLCHMPDYAVDSQFWHEYIRLFVCARRTDCVPVFRSLCQMSQILWFMAPEKVALLASVNGPAW